jgi:hypothetical protein
MSSGAGGRTRREILADAAKAAAAVSVTGLAGCFPSVGGSWSECKSGPDAGAEKQAFQPATNAVVEVFRDGTAAKAGAKYSINADALPDMLDTGLKELARQVQQSKGADAPDTDVDNPWKVLLPGYQPGYRIGLKINCLNSLVPTSIPLVRAIVLSLQNKLSIDPAKIIVWDRTLQEIKNRSRYTDADVAGARLLGTLTTAGTVTEGDPGYGDLVCPAIEGETPRLSRILTDMTDLTINVPVIKKHGVSGVTGAMKNTYGIIDNPGKYHKPKLAKGLPAIYALPAVRNSLVLTIADALIGVVEGNTQDPPDATPNRILLAQDPVAMDNYALDLVNQIRAGRSLAPIPCDKEMDITWIDRAHELGLGNKNYSLVKV